VVLKLGSESQYQEFGGAQDVFKIVSNFISASILLRTSKTFMYVSIFLSVIFRCRYLDILLSCIVIPYYVFGDIQQMNESYESVTRAHPVGPNTL